MKVAKVQITDEIKDILNQGSFDGLKYVLKGNIDRPTYVKVDKVLKAIGAKWNTKQKGHLFPDEVSLKAFKEALGNGYVVDKKKSYGQFDTPVEIAKKLVELACLEEGNSVLEPSAGIGRIADEISNSGVNVDLYLVDIDPDRVKILSEKFDPSGIFLDDFIRFSGNCPELFDRIVANPPFSNGEDAKHVMAMLDILEEGGILVSVMSSAISFRENGPYKQLKDKLKNLDHEIIDLSDGTFKDEGTNVNTCILKVRN